MDRLQNLFISTFVCALLLTYFSRTNNSDASFGLNLTLPMSPGPYPDMVSALRHRGDLAPAADVS